VIESAASLTAPGAEGAAPQGEGQSDNRRRRGRGRGRSERRPDDVAASVPVEAAVAASAAAETSAAVTEPIAPPVEMTEATAPMAEESIQAAVTPEPTLAEPAVAEVAPAAVEPAAIEPAAAVEPVAMAAEQQQPLVEEAVAPAATPAATSAMPAAAPAAVDMSASLQQAGLVLIETAAVSRAAEPIVVPQPPLGRKPKPVATIASEPLQMVETKRD
jgi:hypothetical protein